MCKCEYEKKPSQNNAEAALDEKFFVWSVRFVEGPFTVTPNTKSEIFSNHWDIPTKILIGSHKRMKHSCLSWIARASFLVHFKDKMHHHTGCLNKFRIFCLQSQIREIKISNTNCQIEGKCKTNFTSFVILV